MTDPTITLIAVVQAVVTALQTVDLEFDVGSVLQSLAVRCNGPGQFHVTVEADPEIDIERLDAAIQQLLKGNDHDH